MALPHKFVWAGGEMAVGPGWRADLHHLHLMQQLSPEAMNSPHMVAGTYNEDDFTGQPYISYDWGPNGNVPTDDQLADMVKSHLAQQQHPGRTARRPW